VSRRILLQPFLFALRNRLLPGGGLPLRTVALAGGGLGLCTLLYWLSCRVIFYFHGQSELGIILSLKIFQMAWVIFFAMLVFSSMVSAVSTLFLSQDNEIVFAAPIRPRDLFFMRYTTTTLYTSWMMVLFSLPVFAAYGRVFAAGGWYWPLLALSLLATAAIASGLGIVLTVLLVNIFPARRTKDIVLYLSFCFGIFIYLMFRLLRPEELVNPDQYATFVEYLSSLSRPMGPYLPAAWGSNLLSLYLLDREVDLLLVALLALTPAAVFILGEGAMERWFFPGYSKAQESFGGHIRFGGTGGAPGPVWRWIFAKEAKVFLRDSGEWSQLFMVAALVVVYLYNFTVLPLDRSPLQKEYISNLISFLNIGLTGFIVTSLAARFVYPSVGAEGGAFPLLQASPLSMGRFLFLKYLFYLAPFTGLSLLLVLVSGHLLHIEGPMWWLSLILTLVITWTVLAMALGFGGCHADFKAENRAAASAGLGAFLFLLAAAAFQTAVLLVGAMPAFRVMRAWLRGREPTTTDLLLLAAWLLCTMALALFLGLHFFRKGARRLQYIEAPDAAL
jgi:ABC-2 type transport system permease protein